MLYTGQAQLHGARATVVASGATRLSWIIMVLRRLHPVLVTTVAAASFAVCQPRTQPQTPASGGSGSGAEKRYYLSLGDSLALGAQPLADGTAAATNEGYTQQLYAMARSQMPELEHVNVACGGESTNTMIRGSCPQANGQSGPQLAEAVKFLKAHSGKVAFVTIDIGGNDFAACLKQPDFRACVDLIPQNVRHIVTELRAAAGPGTRIVGMNYYSAALAFWLTGPDGRSRATQLTDALLVFNAALKTTFAAAGIPTVDVAAAFSTIDYTLVTDPRLGEVPLNMQRICQWTWMCVPVPGAERRGFPGDVHPNKEGYRVIAKAFAAMLGL